MRSALTAFVLLALAVSATATPQRPDTLIHEGASIFVYGFHFDPALNSKLYKLCQEDKRWICDSSLWRGYRAVLQIRSNQLFLIGVDFNCVSPKPSPKEILGFDIPDSGVPAKWFSGELYEPMRDTWGYSHTSREGDVAKQYCVLRFSGGVLKKVEVLDSRIPKDIIFRRIEKELEDLQKELIETHKEFGKDYDREVEELRKQEVKQGKNK